MRSVISTRYESICVSSIVEKSRANSSFKRSPYCSSTAFAAFTPSGDASCDSFI